MREVVGCVGTRSLPGHTCKFSQHRAPFVQATRPRLAVCRVQTAQSSQQSFAGDDAVAAKEAWRVLLQHPSGASAQDLLLVGAPAALRINAEQPDATDPQLVADLERMFQMPVPCSMAAPGIGSSMSPALHWQASEAAASQQSVNASSSTDAPCSSSAAATAADPHAPHAAAQRSVPLPAEASASVLRAGAGNGNGTGGGQQRERPGGGQQEKTPDYYANLGDAIRTLREDIPLLFQRDLNYSIYRDDIVFKDPRNTFSGKKNYETIFWSLRFHGRIFFSKLYVEVQRIWQPEDGVIHMRWVVHGVPRTPWEAQGQFGGISKYKLDHTGHIYEHYVDNVLLRDPPAFGLPVLLARLNWGPPQAATWFQPAPPAAVGCSSAGGTGGGLGEGAAGALAAEAAHAAEAECTAGHASSSATEGGTDACGGDGGFAMISGRAGPAGAAGRIISAGRWFGQDWWHYFVQHSWVRWYAAIMATVQLQQQQREQQFPAPAKG